MFGQSSRLFLSSVDKWESGRFRLDGPMTKPAQRAPRFGAFLAETRGDRSRQSVVTQLRKFGVELDQSTLSKYEEEGRVPPLVVLRGLSLVYAQSFTRMLDRLIREQDGRPVNWAEDAGAGTPNTRAQSSFEITSGAGSMSGAKSSGLHTSEQIEQAPAKEGADVGASSGDPTGLKAHTRRARAVDHAASARIANLVIRANRRLDAIREDLNAATAALGGQATTPQPLRPGVPGVAGGAHRRPSRRSQGGGQS